MSNDPHLLAQMDSMFTELNSEEQLTAIQNKWFYPDRKQTFIPDWVWFVVGGVLLLSLILTVYIISYRIQARRITRENNLRNRRLALVLETSNVHIWTYDIKADIFTWRNENGQPAYTYTPHEFSQRYRPEDYIRLRKEMERLAALPQGNEEEEVMFNINAKDTESGSEEMRDFFISLSVLNRDKQGKPTVIIGIKKDITDEKEQQRLADERTMRYWAIFNNNMAGIMYFNKDGRLVNINAKACEIFCCDSKEILNEGITLTDILDTEGLDLSDINGFHATQYIDIDKLSENERKVKSIKRTGKLCNEFWLMAARDDSGDLIGIFAICHDVTSIISELEQLKHNQAMLDSAQRQLQEYDADIDSVLKESDLRLATYSPKSHTLTIYRTVHEVQHSLTQTRCMTLVDDRSKKTAMRMLNDMDECFDKDINLSISTVLRIKGGRRLTVQFCLMPQHDRHGRVTEYFGLCRDISELNDIRHQLKQEAAKVQEVENIKNSFVKNMVQEIRTPLDNVFNYVEQLNPDMPEENEPELSQGILENADYLLHLIDNILYLSRLEAGMVEINKKPHNFAELFESQCMTGWVKYQNAQTRYIVENPYEQLVIDIDSENLGHAIEQITANAAQHTKSGVVRARYDYIGRRLTISIDDTGDGISKADLALINGQLPGNVHTTKGLGLAICRELVTQMGGTLELNSDLGLGTTAYITIPCHATAIKRKKLI